MCQRNRKSGTLPHHTTVPTNIIGKWQELPFHTQEIPGSILGLEVAILKFFFGFQQSFHKNAGITLYKKT
jgi:hypothetical protein